MSSALYKIKVVSKKASEVGFRLEIVHQDVNDFGTDRSFAWKLLAPWVSTAGSESDEALARRIVKSVKLSPIENAALGEEGKGWFSVKRTGKKHPAVVYTIEVSDPSLLDGLRVGNHDEVYDFVEPKKVIPDGDGPQRTRASPRRTQAIEASQAGGNLPGPAQSFDDFRDVALALAAKHPSCLDEMVPLIVRWSESADDSVVRGWLAGLPASEGAWRCRAAGLVAVVRAQSGNLDAARQFLTDARAALPGRKAEQAWGLALEGLIPALWRLGPKAEADGAFKALKEVLEKSQFDATYVTHLLTSLAALGGQSEIVGSLLPEILKRTTREDLLVTAVLTLYRDRSTKLLRAVLAKWNEQATNCHHSLSQELIRQALGQGKPGDYLDLARSFPKVLQLGRCAELAFVEAAKRSVSDAVAQAEAVLDGPFYGGVQLQAVATLATHQPQRAASWVKSRIKRAEAHGDSRSLRLRYLAALGQVDEVRTGLKLLVKSRDSYVCEEMAAVGMISADRALATEAFRSQVTHPNFELDGRSESLVHLADLGERGAVDRVLEKALAKIQKMVPKRRSQPCRNFAGDAAAAGRPDLAMKAIGLAAKPIRRYAADDALRGFAVVGDWTPALAVLEMIPDDDTNGRVRSALGSGLRIREEAFVAGPRAIPLRCLS